ncbi:MAG: hypothetical protein M3Y42_00160 [Actinomycetota bacterium]|nr:hypothetical protein [Actinomycetota bacterium]MDQ2955367.1 hypothetical protein [Actinomycetota bacterium]
MSQHPLPGVMPPIREDQVPSLAIVEAALQREDESYRERANGLDSKAGVILSAAGVIVALVGTHASVAGLIAQIAAIAAGVAAVFTILPRVDKAIGPRQLRDRYLQTDSVVTRLVVLNTRIPLHERNEERLVEKAKRLKVAAGFLLTSASTIAIGGIVEQIRH